MPETPKSRRLIVLIFALAVAGGLAFAFWPRPVIVDLAEITRGPLMVTVDEDGRTRVREAYVVSTPVDGRLLRVALHPGDPVVAGETAVAHMRPMNPAVLDVRSREQARAEVAAAQAALEVAEAELEAASADLDLAMADLRRTRSLAESGRVSLAALDRAESAARAAEARLHTTEAAIAQRRANLRTAELQLIGFDDLSLVQTLEERRSDDIAILAPATGQILRVFHEDETTLPVGAAILEIGNIESDLEVVAELVSTDAVRVHPGDPVIITDWGGEGTLAAEVIRVEPFGETRVSALGVEEQRVLAVMALTSPPEARAGLGHGYRVGVQIVIWRREDALKVPTSALFREDDGQAVFAVEDGVARLRLVTTGRGDGFFAEVLDGLAVGETVVVYPPPGLASGDRVTRRSIDR